MDITVDKERLETIIAKFCPYYYPLDNGKHMCSKHKQDTCNLEFIEKIELNCPYDCPHRDEYKWKECKLGKCSYVKNKIKEIEV